MRRRSSVKRAVSSNRKSAGALSSPPPSCPSPETTTSKRSPRATSRPAQANGRSASTGRKRADRNVSRHQRLVAPSASADTPVERTEERDATPFIFNARDTNANEQGIGKSALVAARSCCTRLETTTFEYVAAIPHLVHLADNEAIHTGYRVPMSWQRALASLFAWHNETVNVWSHGVGAVTFLFLAIFALLGGIAPPPPTFPSGAAVHIPQSQAAFVWAHSSQWAEPLLLQWQCRYEYNANEARPAWCPLAADGACIDSLPWSPLLISAGSHTMDLFVDSISACTSVARNVACWITLGQRSSAIGLAFPHGSVPVGAPFSLDLPGFISSARLNRLVSASAALLERAHSDLSGTPGSGNQTYLEPVLAAFRHAAEGLTELQLTKTAMNYTWYIQLRSIASRLTEVVAAGQTALDNAPDIPGTIVPMIIKAKAYAEQFGHDMRERLVKDMHEWNPALEADLHIDDGRAQTPLEAVEDALHTEGLEPSIQHKLHAGHVPQWPILVFILSAFSLLTASASYHLMHIVDKSWYDFLARLDYAAIALLIFGSSVPCFYYGFYCMPVHYAVYEFFSFLTCGSCLIFGLSEKFRANEWRIVRMSSFLATGLYGVIPFSHMFLASEHQHLEAMYGLALMGILYVSGALLYGFRVPERFFPGRFDLVFASHQIFHVCVFAACIVHYVSTVSYYRWRVLHSVCGDYGSNTLS